MKYYPIFSDKSLKQKHNFIQMNCFGNNTRSDEAV